MIDAYFNERGFHITTSRGASKFNYDSVSDVENASVVYLTRWVVFNEMMNVLIGLLEVDEDRQLTLHSDSRLIEELRGDVSADHDFAQRSLKYFVENDYMRFKSVAFTKCPSSAIDAKLNTDVKLDA